MSAGGSGVKKQFKLITPTRLTAEPQEGKGEGKEPNNQYSILNFQCTELKKRH